MIDEFSQAGTHHATDNAENQDALCHGASGDLWVISLADGVSTCRKAKYGATIACQAITDLFLKKGDHFLEFDEKQIADFAVSHILCELRREAERASLPVEEYSSTVASVLADKRNRRILCFNLGDSMIMAAGNGRCRVLCMPSDSASGCCVTTTERAERGACVKIGDMDQMESILICSDGAWREMFCKNKLKPEVEEMLSKHDFATLKDFLNRQNCFDDHSFITLDMREKSRRENV